MMLRCMSPEMALSRPFSAFAERRLSGADRTSLTRILRCEAVPISSADSFPIGERRRRRQRERTSGQMARFTVS